MDSYETKTQGLLQELKTKASQVKSAKELEQLVIEYERKVAKTAYEELAKEMQARLSPPSMSV
jgi:DNA-binding transcriptional regulator YbjK